MKKLVIFLILLASCVSGPSSEQIIERQREEIREKDVRIILLEVEVEWLKREVEIWKEDNKT